MTQDAIIDTLAAQGYAIVDDFLSMQHVDALSVEIMSRMQQQGMRPAGIGQYAERDASVRGDYTAWLDEASDVTAVQAYFAKMTGLKQAINQQLFMNLHSLETHLAFYPTGSFYQKHLDQFSQARARPAQSRQLSCVLYLNKHWEAQDGGELRLYLDESNEPNSPNFDSRFIDVLPTAGRLVLFLSGAYWHEVRPAKRERMSLTGWFRTRELLV